MARVKSKKYAGVYLNKLVDGDITYSINYKDAENKKNWFTVGKKSSGITETYAYNKRNEFINKVTISCLLKYLSLKLSTFKDLTFFNGLETVMPLSMA